MTEQRQARDSFTLREVAVHYGVSIKAVRRWIKSGDLPATRGPWMKVNYGFTDADLFALESAWAQRKGARAAS